MKESANIAQQLFIEKILKPRISELGLSINNLAEVTGIAKSNLYRFINEGQSTSFTNILMICGALNIRPYFKYSEEDDTEMQYIHFN